MDLTKLTDEELAKHQEEVENELYRRHTLSSSAQALIDIIRDYAEAGGNLTTLAGEIEDALTTNL